MEYFIEIALYGIYALIFVSEIELMSVANEWDQWNVNNYRTPTLSLKYSNDIEEQCGPRRQCELSASDLLSGGPGFTSDEIV